MEHVNTPLTIELIPLRAKVVLRFDSIHELCAAIWYDLDGNKSSRSVSDMSREKWCEFLHNLNAGIAPHIF